MFIVYQLVVMVSALFIYGYLASSHQLKGAAYLCFGINIMVFVAFLQLFPTAQFRWIWTFNHNGIYHLVSILGLSLIFIGIREDFNENLKEEWNKQGTVPLIEIKSQSHLKKLRSLTITHSTTLVNPLFMQTPESLSRPVSFWQTPYFDLPGEHGLT